MEFSFRNPLFLIAFILIVLVIIVKVILKPDKKKNDNKAEMITTEQSEPVDEVVKQEPVQMDIVKQETEKREKKKLRKLKPEITKVYEKKELKPTDESKNKILEEKSQKEEDILKSMQFVKSSKNIERLKPLTASELEERERLRLEQEFLAQTAEQEIDVFNEKIDLKSKSTHFDRTRRLSKMIKEDSLDNMFCSHITEKYMNMDDLEKHLRNCDEIQNKLFNRVAETLVNSEIRLTNDVNGNNDEKGIQIDELERRKREKIAKLISESNNLNDLEIEENELDQIIEEGVDLSARNVLIIDAILKRKGRKNNP